MPVMSLSEEYLMSNAKAQSSNEIQSPNDKINEGKSFDIYSFDIYLTLGF